MGDVGSALSSGLSSVGSGIGSAMSGFGSMLGGGGGDLLGGLASAFNPNTGTTQQGGGSAPASGGGDQSLQQAQSLNPTAGATTPANADPVGAAGGTQSYLTDPLGEIAKLFRGQLPDPQAGGAGAAAAQGPSWYTPPPRDLAGARTPDAVGTVEPIADTNNPPSATQPARPVTPTPAAALAGGGEVRPGAGGGPGRSPSDPTTLPANVVANPPIPPARPTDTTLPADVVANPPLPPARPSDLAGSDANVPAAGATETAGAGVPGAGTTDGNVAQGGLPPGAGNIIRDILGLALGGPQALPQLIGDFLQMAGGGQPGGMGELGNVLSMLGGGMGGDLPSPFAQDVGMWGRRRGRDGWMFPGARRFGGGWRRPGYYPNGRGGWAFHPGGWHPGWGGGVNAGAGRQWGNQPNAAPSGNRFIDTLVGAESTGKNIVSGTDRDSRGLTVAQGGNRNEVSQGYFQIQNHPGGTWQTFARRAGVDLAQYPSPMSAPFAIQHRVAQMIPINQWGPRTKAILHQRFGQFNERMTLGQLEQQFGGGVAGNFGGDQSGGGQPAATASDGGDGASLVGDIPGGDEAFADGEDTAVASQ